MAALLPGAQDRGGNSCRGLSIDRRDLPISPVEMAVAPIDEIWADSRLLTVAALQRRQPTALPPGQTGQSCFALLVIVVV